MNVRNYKTLGVNTNKRHLRSHPAFDITAPPLIHITAPPDLDIGGFELDNLYEDNDIHLPSPADFLIKDTLEDVLQNNPFLTEDYLSGSMLIQSNCTEDEDAIFNEPLYEGTSLTLRD